MDSFATAVSLGLQYGVPLRSIVDKFSCTRFEPSGWSGHEDIGHASSVLDYIARWLELKFLTEVAKLRDSLRTWARCSPLQPRAEQRHKPSSTDAPLARVRNGDGALWGSQTAGRERGRSKTAVQPSMVRVTPVGMCQRADRALER